MYSRFIISALIGAFCLFAIFAAVTTARHLSLREGAASTVKAKQSCLAEYNRLVAAKTRTCAVFQYPA
jgi:hypothetical protein